MRVTNVVRPAPASPALPAAAAAVGAPLPAFEPVALVDEGPDDDEPPPLPGAGPDDPARPATERWRAAVDAVRAVSTRHGASLAHARVLWLRPGDVTVGFGASAEFHRMQLSGAGKALVEQALTRHFGRTTALTVDPRAEAAEAAPPSLAEQDTAERAASQRGADQKVRGHPAVVSILRLLGGEIEHVAVLEPERPEGPAPVEDEERS